MDLREILRVIEPNLFGSLVVVPEFRRGSRGDLAEIFAEPVDFMRALNERFNFHRRAAFWAKQRVDFED